MKHEDFGTISALRAPPAAHSDRVHGRLTKKTSPSLHAKKRAFDLVICLLLLPITLLTGVFLLIANPFFNRGPLFFVQKRMGMDCKPFNAVKFRSMSCRSARVRGAEDPLETDRITKLGSILRKARLDELPQIFNVVLGQMSLIGPRPDCFEHARVFVSAIPEYKLRHSVLPGISGYAQTEVGYVEGVEATRRKVEADLYYIANRDVRMEAWLVWRTIKVMLCRAGS